MKKRTKKTNISGMKELRLILGVSQAQFAAMLGVSKALIKSVEAGRLALSEKLDRRIRVATGASLFGLTLQFKNPDSKRGSVKLTQRIPNGEVRSCWGKGPYTIETFHRHQTKFQTTVEAAKSNLEEMIPELESLFIAAGKPGKSAIRYRLPSLVLSLQEWIEESKKQFNLK